MQALFTLYCTLLSSEKTADMPEAVGLALLPGAVPGAGPLAWKRLPGGGGGGAAGPLAGAANTKSGSDLLTCGRGNPTGSGSG